MKISFEIANTSMETKEPVRIEKVNSNSKYKISNIQKINSILCTPLITEGKILGVVYVDSTEEEKIFDQRDEYFLNTLSTALAIVIKNAQLYSELKKAHQKLLNLDKMKSKFINIASHELRTPLTAIQGYIFLLKNELGHNPKFNRLVTTLEDNIVRLASTINEIINISKLSSKKLPFNFKSTDVKKMIKELVEKFEEITKERNQNFSYNIQPNVDSIVAHKEQLQKAIKNLISNSIRYTPDGGDIRVAVTQDKKNLYIKVIDNGIGMPEEEIDNIFMKFYEVEDTSYHSSGTYEFKTGGLGLGLSIAKEIVEGHGGYIEVKSQVNVGSCFTIVLPLDFGRKF